MTGRAQTSSSRASGTFLSRLISASVLILVVMLIVDGAMPQMELFVTGNRVPITNIVLKAVLFYLLVMVATLRGRLKYSPLWAVTSLLVVFLAVDVPYLHFANNLTFADIFVGYNAAFSIMILAAVLASVPLELSEGVVSKTLMFVFIPCAALGIAQYILQRPIVPATSADDHFNVYAWTTPTGMRSFSFFDLPGRFGTFSAFIACLCAAQIAVKRNIPIAGVFLAASAFCCYIAGSRTQFLALSFGVITSVAVARGYFKRYMKWVPILWFALSWIVIFMALQKLSSGGVTHGSDDATSFGARTIEWQYFLQDLGSKSISQVMLGQGLVQNAKAGGAETSVPVDNMYIGLVLHLGVIGMGIVLLVGWKMWRHVLSVAEDGGSSIAIATAGVVSTIFALGMFGYGFPGIVETVLLVLISIRYPKPQYVESQVLAAA